jgi:hypothetical protein
VLELEVLLLSLPFSVVYRVMFDLNKQPNERFGRFGAGEAKSGSLVTVSTQKAGNGSARTPVLALVWIASSNML